MDNVRVHLTENEKLAAQNLEGKIFNMGEDRDINSMIAKEKAIKFNEELNKIADKFNDASKKLEDNAEKFAEDISKIEIKPMSNRVLIKPFEQNPFQRIKIENGIIVDAGGYTPHTQFNDRTGRQEEQIEVIRVGAVQEIGPDVKYVRPGDCIFYRIDCSMPVPFFKEGFISVAEPNIIAFVNEGLDERLNNIKNGIV